MTKTYTLTELAARIGNTSTAALKRLEKAGAVPIHTREVNGRTFRLYGEDASILVNSWLQARNAKVALRKAREEAQKQRKLARTLKAANATAVVAPDNALVDEIRRLSQRIDLLAVAVEVVSRRVDGMANRWPPAFPSLPSAPWPVISGGTALDDAKAEFLAGVAALTETANFDEPELTAR